MKKVRLGEICDVRDGTHDSPKYHDSGYPLVTSKNLSKGFVDFSDCNLISKEDYNKINIRSKVDVGDILMPMIGTVGNPVIVQIEPNFAIKNVALIKFYNDSKVLNRYIKVLLESSYFEKTVISKIRGGTQKFISLNDIRGLEITLLPINEQLEIADKIEKVNILIDTRKEQLEKLVELVKARFVELMQANPTNNYLKEFISSYKAERCEDRDIPVLSITKEDGIVFQNEKFKKRIASVDASTYKVVPRGKLVQGIHIDERNFAIQNIADEGIVSPAYKVWNVLEEKAIPEVLAFAMRTDKTMAYISSKFTGSVKRRESISMDDFMATPIDLPNIKVQTEFYDFMKQTDKSKLEIQKSLEKLELMKKALMQKYFG